jgi:hypothetical protein
MTSVARTALVCFAAVALLVGAGCGSSTNESNDYVSAVNKVQTDFANSIKKVGSSSSSSTSSDPAAAAKKTFADLNAAIGKVVSDLKAVEPPDKVKALHNELIAEMKDFQGQVKAAGESLKSKDPQAIVTAQSKFAASASSLGTRISKTIDDINSKLQGG